MANPHNLPPGNEAFGRLSALNSPLPLRSGIPSTDHPIEFMIRQLPQARSALRLSNQDFSDLSPDAQVGTLPIRSTTIVLRSQLVQGPLTVSHELSGVTQAVATISEENENRREELHDISSQLANLPLTQAQQTAPGIADLQASIRDLSHRVSAPAPAPALLPIIQHNCLESWNVFLSLFESFREATTYPSIVLLQDPPVNKAHLPSFNGFKSCFPPVRKPRVAAYIHMSFLSNYTVLPRFKEVDDVLALDVSSNEPHFGTALHFFRVINAYSTNTVDHRVYSVPPEVLFPDLGFRLLVVGDLNIHNPLSDPLRHFSPLEISSSTPYFEMAVESGFALLNPPGEYTRFPLVGKARPSVLDLAFENPPRHPQVKSWDASLPSTGSTIFQLQLLSPHPPLTRNPHPRGGRTRTGKPWIQSLRVSRCPPLRHAPPLRNWTNGCQNR